MDRIHFGWKSVEGLLNAWDGSTSAFCPTPKPWESRGGEKLTLPLREALVWVWGGWLGRGGDPTKTSVSVFGKNSPKSKLPPSAKRWDGVGGRVAQCRLRPKSIRYHRADHQSHESPDLRSRVFEYKPRQWTTPWSARLELRSRSKVPRRKQCLLGSTRAKTI